MEIAEIFNKHAQTYDQARRQLVPCFDDFYDAVVGAIPFERDAEIRILDLGAGTGLSSAVLAAAYPRASFTLLDSSEDMLNIARARFAGESERFEFVTGDYVRDDLPVGYDAIVSVLSVHHVSDAQKAALYAEAFESLNRPGVFVNADQIRGETAAITRGYEERWLRQVRARKVSEADLAAALERREQDRSATLDAQLRWLEEAGFENTDCWYKAYMFAVFGGETMAGK